MPLTRLFAHMLAALAHLLALRCLLHSQRSAALICSLAPSHTPELVGKRLIVSKHQAIWNHSAMPKNHFESEMIRKSSTLFFGCKNGCQSVALIMFLSLNIYLCPTLILFLSLNICVSQTLILFLSLNICLSQTLILLLSLNVCLSVQRIQFLSLTRSVFGPTNNYQFEVVSRSWLSIYVSVCLSVCLSKRSVYSSVFVYRCESLLF